MKSLHLYPEATKTTQAHVRRRCRVERYDDARRCSSESLWFEMPALEPLPEDRDSESYLLATVMQAMAERRTVHVHGTVSRDLLLNLTEYRDAWCCWSPRYQPIDFEVEELVDETSRMPGAVCAFSGGVDGAFSVWRHVKGRNGPGSCRIAFAAMVHGFDIPLAEETAFSRAFERAANTLRSLDVELVSVRTNLREVVTENWNFTFAAAIVAALSNFKRIVGSCIIGSSQPYDALALPWGSNPLTDPLLSSGAFQVRHDGATCSRTRKVAELVAWPEACTNLRVCWMPGAFGRNCGECEKCIRTALNFGANRLPVPDCLPARVSEGAIRRLRFESRAVRLQWKELLDRAVANDVRESWVPALRAKLRRQSVLTSVFPPGSRRRDWLATLTRGRLR